MKKTRKTKTLFLIAGIGSLLALASNKLPKNVKALDYESIPTFADETIVDLNEENFVKASSLNADAVSFSQDKTIKLENYSYTKPSAVFMKHQLSLSNDIEIKFKGTSFLTENQQKFTDPRVDVKFVLMSSDALYTSSLNYFSQGPAFKEGNEEVEIRFSNKNISIYEEELGAYEVNMKRSAEERKIAEGPSNGTYAPASHTLLDENIHTLIISTKDVDNKYEISIAIDGEWYVYKSLRTNLNLYKDYYLGFGVEFNWPLDATISEEGQYFEVVSLKAKNIVLPSEKINYDELYDDEYNLVSNSYNFAYDDNIIGFDEEGLKFKQILPGIGNGFALTTGKYNEFDWAFKANFSIFTDSDESQTRPNGDEYHMLKFGFQVDSAKEPTGFNSTFKSMYYSFTIGKSYYAIPQSFDDKSCFISFTRRKGYSDSSEIGSSYLHYKYGYQLCDGNDHWVVLKVRNLVEGQQQGLNIELWIDGLCEISFKDFNQKINESGHLIDRDVYQRKGYLTCWSGSNCRTSTASQSHVDFKEMYVFEYDSNKEGAYVPQTPEPEFPILRNYEYKPQDTYYIGETIVINLNNLFSYNGPRKLSFSVMNVDTQKEIGSINAYGQWSYEAEKVEVIEIKVVASYIDGSGTTKSQNNILTINIEEFNDGVDLQDVPEEKEETEENGCKGSIIAASGLISLFALAGACLTLSRKRD